MKEEEKMEVSKMDMIFLKLKLIFFSGLNKVTLPLTKKQLIDKKHVRHVYLIEKEKLKAFYCMISGKSYIINYNEILEKWFNLSEIEIKKSERVQQSKNIASISNMKDYPEK